jgi:hypothetical protein
MFLMNIYLKHASYELVMSDMIFSLRKSKQNREPRKPTVEKIALSQKNTQDPPTPN